jgi:hypothetical protein
MMPSFDRIKGAKKSYYNKSLDHIFSSVRDLAPGTQKN